MNPAQALCFAFGLLLCVAGALLLARGPREVLREMQRSKKVDPHEDLESSVKPDVYAVRFAIGVVFLGAMLLILAKKA